MSIPHSPLPQLTTAKGLNGTDVLDGDTRPVVQLLPVATGDTVLGLGPVARLTVRVTLLTFLGVLVAVESQRTLGDTLTLWNKEHMFCSLRTRCRSVHEHSNTRPAKAVCSRYFTFICK